MSHELPPKQREQELQFNKFVLDSYVPVLRDIAREGNVTLESPERMEVYQSVVRANGDYYSVRVIDVEHSVYGSGGSHSEIEITRLLEQGDGAPYQTLRQYTYDSMPSTRVIATKTDRVDEDKPGNSHRDSSIDEPNETLLLFSQFATVDDNGDVVMSCEVVDAEQAVELLRKHTNEQKLLFRKIQLLKNHRAPRLKKGMLEKIFGEDGNGWKWS